MVVRSLVRLSVVLILNLALEPARAGCATTEAQREF